MAQLTALQLYQAGFSESQILGFINDQRKSVLVIHNQNR